MTMRMNDFLLALQAELNATEPNFGDDANTVLGLLYGLSDVYYILLLSLVMMAVVSLVLLLLKKVTAKTAVPMAPFVVLGFLVFLFCGF